MSTSRYIPIPRTNHRYWINIHGEVWDHREGDVSWVKPTRDGEGVKVEIEWLGNHGSYLVSKLMVVSFFDIQLPAIDWVLLEPFYKDGNPENLDVKNIAYRFSKLIENETFPNFYYIPYYTRYCINEDGEIINAVNGKIKKWHVTNGGNKNSTGGYRYTRVLSNGKSTNLGRHRALCLTFKHYDKDPSELIVNHDDTVPGNDWLDNLEWCGHSYNNQHAYDHEMRPNASRPVLMKDLRTGEVRRFVTTASCARYLGYKTGTIIWWRLTKHPEKVYPDLLQFKWDDGSEWVNLNIEDVKWGSKPRPAQARNVFTGEIINFIGLEDGQKKTGVDKTVISSHLQHQHKLPFYGFNFRYVDQDIKWPSHTDRHLRIYKKYPKKSPDGVIVWDMEERTEMFFLSRAEAAEFFGASKSFIAKMISSNMLYRKRYRLSYFKLKENLGPLQS